MSRRRGLLVPFRAITLPVWDLAQTGALPDTAFVAAVVRELRDGSQSGNRAASTASELHSNVRVMDGVQEILEDFLVPKGTVLIIRPGTHLRMGPNVRIHVEGRIIARGTQEAPIVFSAAKAGTYWRGIEIKASERPPKLNRYWKWLTKGDSKSETVFFDKIRNGNWFEHCVFRNLATAKIQWERDQQMARNHRGL